jgi:hypothetical protein
MLTERRSVVDVSMAGPASQECQTFVNILHREQAKVRRAVKQRGRQLLAGCGDLDTAARRGYPHRFKSYGIS